MKKLSTGKLVAIICGSVLAVIIFLAVVFIGIYSSLVILYKIGRHSEYSRYYDEYIDEHTDSDNGYDYDDYYDDYDDYYNDYYDDDYYDDDYYDYDYEFDLDADYYSEFRDDIREELSYSVEFDTYEIDEDGVYVNAIYPIISNTQYDDVINEVIQGKLDEVTKRMGEHMKYPEEDIAVSEVVTYVTYMDEDVISIIFDEFGYGTTWEEAYLSSLNFDIETGLVIDNTSLLYMDDEFAIDFRNRSDMQNGEVYFLTNLMDQEITAFLNNKDYLIAFYTPLGMEIGFQYPNGLGWVTVTYKEYEQYQQQF